MKTKDPKTFWLDEQPISENNIKATTNRICRYLWAGFGIVCLIGVLQGAWWHLLTTFICLTMWAAYKAEQPENNGR